MKAQYDIKIILTCDSCSATAVQRENKHMEFDVTGSL